MLIETFEHVVVEHCRGECILTCLLFTVEMPMMQLENVDLLCDFSVCVLGGSWLPERNWWSLGSAFFLVWPVSKGAHWIDSKMLDKMKQLSKLLEEG